MGVYLGKLYFEKKDLYYFLGVGLILLGRYLNYPLPYISYDALLILAVLFYLAKGLILPAYDSILVVVFVAALMLTLFLPLLQILLFVLLALLFLRLLRVI